MPISLVLLLASATPETRTSSATELILDAEEFEEQEIVITAKRRSPTSSSLSGVEAARLPGAQGDPVKGLETLPGVSRSALGQGELSIWGASPSDTRAYIDGVLVPRLFHLGGARSIIAPERIDTLQLTPGGYGAAFGRALGGLIQLSGKTGDSGAPPLRTIATADLFDVSAAARAKLKGSGFFEASGRKSIIDATLGGLIEPESRQLYPLPSYFDYHTKLAIADAQVHAFGAGDRVGEGETLRNQREMQADFHRLSIRMQGRHADGSSYLIHPWVGLDRSKQTLSFGDSSATLEEQSWRAALRFSERSRLFENVELTVGIDLEGQYSSFSQTGALTLFSREGDITIFGREGGNRVNADAWQVRMGSAALYTELQLIFGPLRIQPGLRAELSVQDSDRILPTRGSQVPFGLTEISMALDPRLQIVWRASSAISLRGALGRYHQPPSPRDLSPVFGNPSLGQSAAWHALLGLDALLFSALTIELTFFGIQQDDLVVRSTLPTPPQARALVNAGKGRNFGAQLALEYAPLEALFAALSYTLMRAERSHEDETRLFDEDQTHVLSATIGWSLGWNIRLGLRARYATGRPFTPVVGAFINGQTGRFEPIFGAQNSARLPAFFELSARVGWSHSFSWIKVHTFLDVQNLTNTKNAETALYNSDFTERAFISGLPLLPFLGVKAEL